MKINSLKFLISFLSVILLSSGCDKDENEASKATFWPNIEINGDEFVVLEDGAAYTELGATVTINGAEVPYETTSDVDDTEYGAYTVVYSAANDDGITATKTRTVIVVDSDAAADDLSGSYQRGSGVPMTVWSKHPTKPYTYNANNPGGVGSNPPFDVPFIIYNVAPGIVVVPLQSSPPLAPFFATSGSVGGSPLIPFNVGAGVGDVAYAWYMNGPNFGTVLRTFIKR